MGLGASLLALMCSACGCSPSEPASGAPGAEAAPHVEAPRRRAAPRDERPQLGKSSGEIAGQGDLAEGAKLEVDVPLTLGADARLDLRFPGGASVTVSGPAQVAVPAGERGLLVHAGTVSVDLEWAASHPDSGFCLATPAARLELVHGGRFVVRAFADLASQVSVVNGPLALSPVGAEGASARPLGAGARVSVRPDGELALSTAPRGPQGPVALHLQAEESRLRGLPEPTPAGAPVETHSASAVQAACERVVSAITQERALQARHRALVAKQVPGAMDVQRELAAQAAQTFAARRSLARRLSMLEAESLGRGSAGLTSPEIARARELLRELRP